MKMRKGRPARVMPRHLRGLVITCLTLVSLHVTSASGSYQGQTNILPGNKMPSNFSSSSTPFDPPTTATLLMECTSPAGHVHDQCWLDDNTMVIVHRDSKKVVKVIVNRKTKTCTYSYYSDNPPVPHRVDCSPGGEEIYVTNYKQSSVWVYDRDRLKAVWYPEGLVGNPWTVAVNRQNVVVSAYPRGPLYVYNRNRLYIGQISVSQNLLEFSCLNDEGLFVASTGGYHRLVIHDIPHGSTIIVGGPGSENGQFNTPYGVSNVGEYILVCDHYNDRVPVFTQNGGFEGNLQFKGTDVSSPTSISYRSETKLLVVNSHLHSYVKIFSLMT